MTPGSVMRLRRQSLMLLRRGRLIGLRRGTFIAILVALAVVPGPASAARPCTNRACQSAGLARWARLLPGAWLAQAGLAGTTPAQGDAYAAMGGQVAAIGIGTKVFAYWSRSGAPAWASSLAGFRAGSRIVSVRAWPGVITAGVDVPGRRAGSPATRHEVVLDSGTGRLIRSFRAAPFGGAVAAGPVRTVIVDSTAVTSYSNRTGAVLWSHPTGPAAKAWKVSGNDLYLTRVGRWLPERPGPSCADLLRSGAQRIIRPPGKSFRGVLSRVFAGVAVFTDARGTIAYSATTGRRLWRRLGAVPENADALGGLLYLTDGGERGPRDRPDAGLRPARRIIPGPPASMLCGMAWCSVSIRGPRGMRGATTCPSAGCSGPTPTCRGRTISRTCRVSAAAPARNRGPSCWRSALRPGRPRRAAPARSATVPNWSP